MHGGDGAVRFFEDSRDLGDRQTTLGGEEKVVMILLEPGWSCWLLDNAVVKAAQMFSGG